MRHWMPALTAPPHAGVDVLTDVIDSMALAGFAGTLLDRLRSIVPATSLSAYRTGPGLRPQRYLGASHRTPDTTRDCWRAYMSGPWLRDQTLMQRDVLSQDVPVVCHITAAEVPREHRAKVYEAHGMAERVSVVRRAADESVFALNLYRHVDQRPFTDAELMGFCEIAPALLAMTCKHVALLGLTHGVGDAPRALRPHAVRAQLLLLHGKLTPRELDVCERLLRGMTQEAVAADLALGLPTVRTYRNRAFGRLGIHFRSELFALMRAQGV